MEKCLLLVLLLLAYIIGPVHAGDEDMNPTIYQQFDPETGFMIPIPAPTHAPVTQSQTQTDTSQTVPITDNDISMTGQEQAVATSMDTIGETESGSPMNEMRPSTWIIMILMITGIGVIGLWLAKKTKIS